MATFPVLSCLTCRCICFQAHGDCQDPVCNFMVTCGGLSVRVPFFFDSLMLGVSASRELRTQREIWKQRKTQSTVQSAPYIFYYKIGRYGAVVYCESHQIEKSAIDTQVGNPSVFVAVLSCCKSSPPPAPVYQFGHDSDVVCFVLSKRTCTTYAITFVVLCRMTGNDVSQAAAR